MTCGATVKTVEKVLRANLLASILIGDKIFLEKLSSDLLHCRNNIEFRTIAGGNHHGFMSKAAGNKAGNELLVLNF